MLIKLLENIKLAFGAVFSKKIRSFLTMLGVIIGVFSIVLLVSLGEGVKQEVTGEIEGLGSNLLFVVSGNIDTESGGGGFSSGASFVGASTLTLDDVSAIQRINGINQVVPLAILTLPISTTPANGNGVVPLPPQTFDQDQPTPSPTPQPSSSILVFGSNENVKEAFTGQLTQGKEYGRMFTREEYDGAARVAVGYAGAMKQLFPDRELESLIGETIYVGNEPVELVGLLEAEESVDVFGGNQFSNLVIIPLTTAEAISESVQIDRIVVTVNEADAVDAIKTEMEAALLATHDSIDNFSVLTQEDILSVFDRVLGVITGMLTGIAAISLLVGGIGVMNIMLVSVTERIKEIGLRKAIGASRFDILLQFLIEAVILSVLGGAIGVGLAFMASSVIDAQLGLAPVITMQTVLLAFLFTVGIGIFFGVAPAIRAARLDPIDALKYE